MADARELLKQLQRSDVFVGDFPRRVRRTHAELSRLPEEELRDLHQPGLEAIARVKNAQALADIARQLGAAKLSRRSQCWPQSGGTVRWSRCGRPPGTRYDGSARQKPAQVLIELIEDSDHLSVFLAVRAIFDAAPMEAFDKLLPYFDAERSSATGRRSNPRRSAGLLCAKQLLE